MDLLTTWQQSQDNIKEKVGISAYQTWFAAIRVTAPDTATLILETPDEFFKNWIVDHYLTSIREELNVSAGQNVAVEVTVNSDLQAPPETSTPFPGPQTPARVEKTTDIYLNPRFSFNNFVVGPSNRFAYAASLAVAESPAKAYNPLFLYGKVGLGKTHLMQSIANHIKTKAPETKYCYISSERFTNELIEAIRHRSTPQFRQKYRDIDVLLIDDIHFIAGKESTQEEFFHTFNALHNNRKQIIISSDRPPKDIANLEERLSSRFAWGLITDIQPPDYETRVAILRKKCEREPVDIPDDVISFIAEQIRTNIRELEGALIRVVAYSLLEEKPISLETAKMVLKDLVQETIKQISAEAVLKHVSEHFKISVTEMKAKRRNKNVLYPRQIAMFLTRRLTHLSLPEIGQAFGGKDHTTVLHSCKKIEQSLDSNSELKQTIEKLSTGIQG